MVMEKGHLRALTFTEVMTERESVLLLVLIISGPLRGTVAALLCSLFPFLYSSTDGFGSKNRHVDETGIQRKKV